ncbi:hypothetical protein BC831DRAFT_39644 [Entophlyctis helioformis]|nr:hypothetical protein BC831DRAFT_39644 [Entophlyctis helioformis]
MYCVSETSAGEAVCSDDSTTLLGWCTSLRHRDSWTIFVVRQTFQARARSLSAVPSIFVHGNGDDLAVDGRQSCCSVVQQEPHMSSDRVHVNGNCRPSASLECHTHQQVHRPAIHQPGSWPGKWSAAISSVLRAMAAASCDMLFGETRPQGASPAAYAAGTDAAYAVSAVPALLLVRQSTDIAKTG